MTESNESGGPLTNGVSLGSDPCATEASEGREELTEDISSESFDDWYREREFAQNIKQGTSYFNGPSKIKSPTRLSPSRLLQCQRKSFYTQLNAPEESSDPRGIFYFGSRFENDIVIPFFEEVAQEYNKYVTNSLWVDFTEKTENSEIRIKGETDPVIVDQYAEPVLLSEIKTKRSIEDLESPNQHHLAQIHAYMRGLSEKYDREVSEAIILYGSRTTLDIQVFHIEFDRSFWNDTVLEWAANHTEYRLADELPPAEPEYDWECSFCSFRERCGKGGMMIEDVEAKGLIPVFSDYPKEKLIEYLEAHEGAKLTPTLAQKYPALAEGYAVYDWVCSTCGNTQQWDALDSISIDTHPPKCGECYENGRVSYLSGPGPDEQQPSNKKDADDNIPDTNQ